METAPASTLSAAQLRSPTLVGSVEQALTYHGLSGHDLELEVTESVAMHDPETSISQLVALRNLGMRLGGRGRGNSGAAGFPCHAPLRFPAGLPVQQAPAGAGGCGLCPAVSAGTIVNRIENVPAP